MDHTLLLTLIFAPFVQGALFAIPRLIPVKYLGYLSCILQLCYLTIVISFARRAVDGFPLELSIPWAPSLMVNLSFSADGLALFFSLLITAMGALVSLYAQGYMSPHDPGLRKFYVYLCIFMGAMLGAVLASNFLLLFLFWETTGVISYLLISYHSEKPQARQAARGAFLVGAMAALGLLLGITLIAVLDGTLEFPQVQEKGIADGKHPFWIFAIMFLLLIGIFGKSAQFPFHFWLPEAMQAPTPVSAYLHSATMVKLGIYLIARIYPLFVETNLWFPLITSFSLITVLVGGILALFSYRLKQILAYATVSQLGFFISFYGIHDPQGLEYDYVHIFNHALYKGSLFMLVGILSLVAGVSDIRQLPGVLKKMPVFAAVFIVSLAAMAGVPGTTGFLSKELLVRDIIMLLQEEPVGFFVFFGLLIGLLLKVAFSYRLFYYAFLKDAEQEIKLQQKPSFLLLISPMVLAVSALILGVWPDGLEILTHAFLVKAIHKEHLEALAVWHGFSLNLFVSVLLFALGIRLFYLTKKRESLYSTVFTPFLSKKWLGFLEAVPTTARAITSCFHSTRPERHLYWILAAVLLGVGYSEAIASEGFYLVTIFTKESTTHLLLALSIMIFFVLKVPLGRLAALSVFGFLTTYYFIVKEAPDVAITQMVVEVASFFVLLLVFSLISKESKPPELSKTRLVVALFVGLALSALPFFFQLGPRSPELARFFLENTESLAKGKNAVNTILVDFRAFDTYGEILVVAIAALGVSAMFHRISSLDAHSPPFIPTPLISAIIPTLFYTALPFSVYLTLKGHNEPGGGFAGGMVLAISFILVGMAIKKSRIFVFDCIRPHQVIYVGAALATLSAIIPMIGGGAFMEARFLGGSAMLSTPVLFDLAVFLLVIGAVTSMVFLVREHTIRRKV